MVLDGFRSVMEAAGAVSEADQLSCRKDETGSAQHAPASLVPAPPATATPSVSLSEMHAIRGDDRTTGYFFSAGVQFISSVIGVAVASFADWLIRNRPSRPTAYCGRFVGDPPAKTRVGKSFTGVPASNDGPDTLTGAAIIVASGARK